MKTKHYLTILALIIFQSTILSQTHTWTGNGGDNNWFNDNNWDVGSVPSASSDVLIPGNFVEVDISETAAQVNSIEISGSTILNIGNDLQLRGQLYLPTGSKINWTKGIIDGGGTIENGGLIKLESHDDKELINSNIENNGVISIINSNIIRFSEGTLINNYENARIEIYSNGGIIQDDDGNTINNYGTIRKPGDGSGSLGSFYMIFDLNNAGTIHIGETQQFLFLGSDITFNNLETGVLEGFGAFDITSNFTNVGTYAPGDDLTCGTLSVYNSFNLSSETELEFLILGKNPGEYDAIDVAGFPHLEGNIIIHLYFYTEVGDEFQVITANEIMSCNFPETVTAQYQGNEYTFEIICDDTSVVLKVVDIILGVDEHNSDILFYVQPNPVKDFVNIVFRTSGGKETANEALSLNIYNSQGREVKTITNFSKQNNSFQKGNLSAGLYILQIKANNAVLATTKMVVD